MLLGPHGGGRAVRPADQLLLVLVLGGTLMGIAASIRELVKERPVYRRERATGLSLSAYLTSKVLVLGVVTAVQAAVFTVLALLGHRPPDAPVVLGSGVVEVLLAVVAVSVLTMVVGLVISGFIDNADRGMSLLVLVLMLQLVVSGGLFPVHGRAVLEQVAWLVPSRWAYAIGASTVGLNPNVRGDPTRCGSTRPARGCSRSACSRRSCWCCWASRRGSCAGRARCGGRPGEVGRGSGTWRS